MAANCIAHFFILNPRGETIISKDFRGDAARDESEIFFRKVKFWDGGGDAPPGKIFDSEASGAVGYF